MRVSPSTPVAYLHLQYEFKLLFREILAKEKNQIITIPPRNVEEAIRALADIEGHHLGKCEMSLDVASQCKTNWIIEIFVQILVTSRQKYSLANSFGWPPSED